MTLPDSAAPALDATPTTRELFDPPGGVLMWLVLSLELFAFSMLFVGVAYLRSSQPAVFHAGQSALDPRMGLLLTLTLLTSGWLTAEGVHAFRESRFERARRYYAGASLMGLGFVGLKVYEYASKARAGHGLGADDFWDLYFLATGFHFIHVLVGLGLIVYVGARVGRTTFEDPETTVGGTALFWHMCDVAWFFLFPLFFARS